MPRRREPDAEDMLARCPHCRGVTVVVDTTTSTKVPCPVCAGAGRVNQRIYLAYQSGTLEVNLAGTLPAGSGPASSAGTP